ncbi:hypothetical protein Pta02_15050 [Planobispora takensis]|uniref:Uncharacterized protein n=1 Tax=Planobispora takensis TaxID=1367882 RepID=A0A8J3WU30_9ACTN|nr:hypothetical protein Pta02_15050 [Planobispora takensis]
MEIGAPEQFATLAHPSRQRLLFTPGHRRHSLTTPKARPHLTGIGSDGRCSAAMMPMLTTWGILKCEASTNR